MGKTNPHRKQNQPQLFHEERDSRTVEQHVPPKTELDAQRLRIICSSTNIICFTSWIADDGEINTHRKQNQPLVFHDERGLEDGATTCAPNPYRYKPYVILSTLKSSVYEKYRATRPYKPYRYKPYVR